MSIRKAAAAILASSALVLGVALPAGASTGEVGQDIVIGGGRCSEKDVIIIVPNPVNDDVYRVCFDWPVA